MTTRFQSAVTVLLVGDIAATLRWYRDVLGFDGDAVPDAPPHNFAILQRDEVVLFLQQLSGYQKPDVYSQREGGVWSFDFYADVKNTVVAPAPLTHDRSTEGEQEGRT